ncbi:MAG: hypothetical protein IPJ28_01310 [Betaproteobacteria bacterium]|nr:hypothetical protein [Betaproteobacteria bacterium]
MTKQHIFQWLNWSCFKPAKTSPNRRIWLIADITREQANTFVQIVLRERAPSNSTEVDLYVLTTDWAVRCLKRSPEDSQFRFASKDYGDRIAREAGAWIFELLRAHDSRLFWEGMLEQEAHATGSPFIREQVIWARDPKSDRPAVVLHGYQTYHALVAPRRAIVATRALGRTWYLRGRREECVAADALLTNLLPREARRSLLASTRSASDEPLTTVVSSVFVTGTTADAARVNDQEEIHLLRHNMLVMGAELVREPVHARSSIALNWNETAFDCDPCPAGELPYEREFQARRMLVEEDRRQFL